MSSILSVLDRHDLERTMVKLRAKVDTAFVYPGLRLVWLDPGDEIDVNFAGDAEYLDDCIQPYVEDGTLEIVT